MTQATDRPTIVWTDSGVNIGGKPCVKTGGLRFGGDIVFHWTGYTFYVPMVEDEKKTEELTKLGKIGSEIVRAVAQILGIDEIQIKSNYEFWVSLEGVYQWGERRSHILEEIRTILNAHGYNFIEKPDGWVGEARRPHVA